MSAITKIAWTDRTWNCVRGCSRVSLGCGGPGRVGGCYAERQAHRFNYPGGPYDGLTRMTANGPRWTGVVRLVPEALNEPLRWRKPQKIFVNSMSDLFHESLPSAAIAAVFGIMACSPQHTFQILTKRSDRMRQWTLGMQEHHRHQMTIGLSRAPVNYPHALDVPLGWPLPNVWLGVSVEDQTTADQRIPLLLQTPAAVRWVSYEPALSAANFSPWLVPTCSSVRADPVGEGADCVMSSHRPARLDWVVVGGESGPGARPFDLAWARSVIKQCRKAGVACFVKQLGAQPRGCLSPCDEDGAPPGGDSGCDAYEASEISAPCPSGRCVMVHLRDRKGGVMEEWPEDLRVREFPA